MLIDRGSREREAEEELELFVRKLGKKETMILQNFVFLK